MEPEMLEPSWSFYGGISSIFDQVESFDFNMDTSVFTASEDTCSEIASNLPFPSTIFLDNHVYCTIDENSLQFPSLIDDFSMDLDGFDPTLSSQSLANHGSAQELEGSFPSKKLCFETEDVWTLESNPIYATRHVYTISHHTSRGRGDGEPVESSSCSGSHWRSLRARTEHTCTSDSETHQPQKQGIFIKREASKSFFHAFKAIYQGLPHGKTAHFAANSAILDSIPADSEVIHLIDFDMGDGCQWPPLVEAIAQLHKTLKLTSIRHEEEDNLDADFASTQWKFKETRRKLYEHAKSCGLKLNVEEKSIEELATDLKKLNKRGGYGNGKRSFVTFNCRAGLPHMGRVRSRNHVLEFLRVAKDFIKSAPSNRGIIAFGDGEACEKLRNSNNFLSFFNGHLVHYHASLESIESNFPSQFSEARTAMENPFVAPCISCEDWFHKWDEMRQDGNLQAEIDLGGGSLREETLTEVGEMLRGMEGWYEVKIEGNNGNEMVLQWKGTQLLRISIWAN
ncbi:nodulation-signaling pathway 2 protein-like [Neltuma alba]|uniref:nodulation-signaling pathway 2 protein-like n=1 Tax=Neltuma alba TaxID=207710 RepID=UPI0010A32DD7|nr:nodulation-signaling pathway 2 protein-like [Prosopis alba]